jgi:sulfate adenylyltransferase subunit 1 (EFTu-like GTPase family)
METTLAYKFIRTLYKDKKECAKKYKIKTPLPDFVDIKRFRDLWCMDRRHDYGGDTVESKLVWLREDKTPNFDSYIIRVNNDNTIEIVDFI